MLLFRFFSRFYLTLFLILLLPLSQGFAQISPKIVTAAQVNGTWKNKEGSEFKIWALGQQKLQVSFSGIYEYKSSYGPMANIGEADGQALIEGDTAQFKPEGTKDCLITLQFSVPRLIVTEQGSCGFGMNVTAQGTYRKINGRKPSFQR